MSQRESVSLRSARAMSAGVVVALGIALLDLLMDLVLPEAPFRRGILDRLALVAPLPLLGLITGLLLGRAPWPLSLGLAALAARLGRILTLGQAAQLLPLARYWHLIAAALAFGTFFFLRGLDRRPRLGRILRRIGVPLFALIAIGIAFVERGHYRTIREGGLIVMALLTVTLLAPAAPPLTGRRRWGLALASALLALVGCFGILREDGVSEWAHHRMSFATSYARPLWKTLGQSPRVFVSAVELNAPTPSYAGSRLEAETRERLFAKGRPRGVLMITIDALRADLVGREVGGRPVTPFLNELTRTGFHFERAYTPANQTRAAFASIFSGCTPDEILARTESSRPLPLVTRPLRDLGVRCRGHFFFVAATGTAASNEARGVLGFEPEYQVEMKDRSVDEVAAKLAPDADAPWLSFAHLMRPHWPYEPAPAFRAGDSAFERYCGEVRQADDELRRLVERLQDDPEAGNFWIIVSADHGEEFREHGQQYHGLQLFEETIRVPLVISGPGVPPGSHVDPVSLRDLAPTLLDIFGASADDIPPRARSLLPIVAGLEDPDRFAGAMIEMPDLTRRVQARALIRRDRKTVVNHARGTIQHYDLRADPRELKDISEERPDAVRADLRDLTRQRHFELKPAAPVLDWSLIDADETRSRSELVSLAEDLLSRLGEDPQVAVRLALIAPVLTHAESAELLRQGPAAGGPLRDVLRAFAGERGPALTTALLARLRADRPAFETAAVYAALDRMDEDGALDFVPKPLYDPREKLAVELARAVYRAGRGERAMNFRLVQDAAESDSTWLQRRGADYLAVIPFADTNEQVRAEIVRVFRTTASPRHRCALLRILARRPDENFRAVANEVWTKGGDEERATLAALLIGGAAPSGTSGIFRGEGGPVSLPQEGLSIPQTATELWLLPALPPRDAEAPVASPLRIRIGGKALIEVDAATTPPGAALRIPIPRPAADEVSPSPGFRSIALLPEESSSASTRPGVLGFFAR